MCNKLIVLYVVLVVVGLSVPALASADPTAANPLKVDITYAPDGQAAQAGYQNWGIIRDWTSPVSTSFPLDFQALPWDWATATLSVYRKNKTPDNTGFSRNRSGGFAAVGPNPSWEPLEYSAAGKGYGTNYVKLTLSNLTPGKDYQFFLWSFERREVWSASSANPDSKYGVWSTLGNSGNDWTPLSWLNANGYSGFNGEPNGYGPITPVPDPPTGASGMPAGLADLVAAEGGRVSMMAPLNDDTNFLGGSKYLVSFSAITDDEGTISIYGWIDPTDWTGSQHMPLNGFMVIPEPATVCLFGIGALSLLRRKRA
jgi:hypothetical protein